MIDLTLAHHNFERWNSALQTLDPEQVAALYTADDSFLPTLSHDFKHGHDGTVDYFQHFLEKHPHGTLLEEEVQALGDNAYVHSGMYDFEIGPDEARQNVHARFTYVWVKDDSGEWKIAHHHSSLRPE